MMAAPNDVASLGTGKGTLAAVDEFATPNSVPKLSGQLTAPASTQAAEKNIVEAGDPEQGLGRFTFFIVHCRTSLPPTIGHP
jgi:hypothetical protein